MTKYFYQKPLLTFAYVMLLVLPQLSAGECILRPEHGTDGHSDLAT